MTKEEREALVDNITQSMVDGRWHGGETLLEMYALSALAAIEQAGYWIAPVEPTEEMLRAGEAGANECYSKAGWSETSEKHLVVYRHVYRSLRDAARKPERETDSEGGE